jgi:hypothetical protein
MIGTAYHRKIAKMIAARDNEAVEHEKQEGFYNDQEQPSPPNKTITHLTGYEKSYKKQVPVIASGRPNMEMAEKVKKPKARKIAKNNLPLVYQDQMTQFQGGAGEEEELEDTERNVEERELGAGVNVKELEKVMESNELKSGLVGSAGKSNRLKARSAKVKEIMKEKGLSMIEASKYIKANNIQY